MPPYLDRGDHEDQSEPWQQHGARDNAGELSADKRSNDRSSHHDKQEYPVASDDGKALVAAVERAAPIVAVMRRQCSEPIPEDRDFLVLERIQINANGVDVTMICSCFRGREHRPRRLSPRRQIPSLALPAFQRYRWRRPKQP